MILKLNWNESKVIRQLTKKMHNSTNMIRFIRQHMIDSRITLLNLTLKWCSMTARHLPLVSFSSTILVIVIIIGHVSHLTLCQVLATNDLPIFCVLFSVSSSASGSICSDVYFFIDITSSFFFFSSRTIRFVFKMRQTLANFSMPIISWLTKHFALFFTLLFDRSIKDVRLASRQSHATYRDIYIHTLTLFVILNDVPNEERWMNERHVKTENEICRKSKNLRRSNKDIQRKTM